MFRRRIHTIGKGVGGRYKTCYYDNSDDRSVKNITRDFVVGNDYDQTETEMMMDANDEMDEKNNCHQIGNGKLRKQRLLNLKHRKGRKRGGKGRRKGGRVKRKKRYKKRRRGRKGKKGGSRGKSYCSKRHSDKCSSDIFNTF